MFYKAGVKVNWLIPVNNKCKGNLSFQMRDQCGTIFRQAKKELDAAGLLKHEKDAGKNSNGGEEALASDIDKELESLQVS